MATIAPRNPFIVVLGATGTGKSQLAIDLATRLNGEVINGDAMQMYNGLPIITNKVTSEEQNGIPHHLIGFIPYDEEPWRVGLFRKRASQVIAEIRSRGRLPILVGGTHYYTQSLLFDDSLVDSHDSGTADQQELKTQEINLKFPILEGSTEDMILKLKEVDPMMAERWHPNDRRKIRRSLEIFFLTGKKASEVYDAQKKEKSAASYSDDEILDAEHELRSTLLFWVYSEPEALKQRLDLRVDKMLENGLLEEVKSMSNFLLDSRDSGVEIDLGRGIWVSIGWKEFDKYLAALQDKSVPQEELNKLLLQAIEQVKTATRQYARRQNTWLRGKFLSALQDNGALEQLYLLDGSDLKTWRQSVSEVALDIAETFVNGGKLRPPTDISSVAQNILNPDRLNGGPEEFGQRTCELCCTTVVTEDQWQKHRKGRTHRRLAKRAINLGTEIATSPI